MSFKKNIYFRLCWVFIALCGFSLVAATVGYSSLLCMGFSLKWLLFLRYCAARGLLLPDMWNLPGPEIEPMSRALAERFLTIDWNTRKVFGEF